MKKLPLIAILLYGCMNIMAQINPDAIPAYVLVRAITNGTGDMDYQRGFPVIVSDRNQYVGGQTMPKFVQFVITNATVGQVQAYADRWMRAIDWEVVDSDQPMDTWYMKAFTDPTLVSATGLNSLESAHVEEFLNNWNAVVTGSDVNEVFFTANIYNAITSKGFWMRSLNNIYFNELSYDAPSGEHEIRVDYSETALTYVQLVPPILENGCTITGNNNGQKTIDFLCSRTNIFQKFKAAVKRKTDYATFIRRWSVNEAAMLDAETSGGSIEVTKAYMQSNITNRLAQ